MPAVDFDQLQLKSEFNDIRRRLSILERRQRRLLGLVLVLGAALAGLAATAFSVSPVPGPKTVEAQRFVVRERGGAVLAELGATDDGVMLSLFGASGWAKLGVDQRRAALILDAAGGHTVYQVP